MAKGNAKTLDGILLTEMLHFGIDHLNGKDHDHGPSSQRLAAFLTGYYGGPGFCGLGSPIPPASGRVIAPVSGSPTPPIAPGSALQCIPSHEPDGLHVRNSRAFGDCMFTMLPEETRLPDHFRIELTVTGS
jgi:hypothetical protein